MDKISLQGNWTIEARSADNGEILWQKHIKNQLTAINQSIRTQMLLGTWTGAADAMQIKYFAFGDGAEPASKSDTTLQNERFRKQITRIELLEESTVQTVLSLGTAEANFVIREIGVFCGPSATSDANTGIMMSRVNVNIPNNSNIVLNFIRRDICTI